jgi:hypothetical protein
VGEDVTLREVVGQYGEKIRKAIRMPFLPLSEKKAEAKLIGTTFY